MGQGNGAFLPAQGLGHLPVMWETSTVCLSWTSPKIIPTSLKALTRSTSLAIQCYYTTSLETVRLSRKKSKFIEAEEETRMNVTFYVVIIVK